MVAEWKQGKMGEEWPSVEADTIPKLLKLRSQKLADKIFMRQKDLGIWQRFTWKDVFENTRTLSLGLLKLGLRRGETVAIAGENQKELFWCEYAILAVGGKAVCLYPTTTASEMKQILAHSDSVYLVAQDQSQIDKALQVKAQIPKLKKIIYWDPKGMWHYNEPSLMELKEVQSEGADYGDKNPNLFEEQIDQGKGTDIAILSYSTPSKGVILTHHNLLDQAYRVSLQSSLRPFTQYLSHISPAWSTEQVFGITLGLLVPFVINFPRGPETVKSNIREVGVEALVWGSKRWESLASMVQGHMRDAGVVRRVLYNIGIGISSKITGKRIGGEKGPISTLLYPIANRLILRAIRDNLGFTRTHLAISEGTPMAPESFRFFHSIGIKLRNGYGLSETGLLTLHEGERFDLKTVGTLCRSHPAFGPPLEMKSGQGGELLVRGGAGFSGYYKDPETSAAKMVDGWFRTGDVGHTRKDGQVVYVRSLSDVNLEKPS